MIKLYDKEIQNDVKADFGVKTKRGAAYEAGVSDGTLRNFINRNIPKLNTLERIADAFGYDLQVSFIKRNGKKK